MRHPEHPDQQAPDDYVGAGTASHFMCSSNLAQRILDYGRNNKVALPYIGIKIPYVYNNVNPGVWNPKAFIGRQPQLICHLQFAAGENPPLWRKLWWIISIIISAHTKKENQDAYTLAWHLTRVAEGKSFICDLAIKYWRYKQKSKRPGGISEVLSEYFQNPTHPLVKYLANSK